MPFKRTPANAAARDAGHPTAAPAVAAAGETNSYPDGTQKVQVSDTLIERPTGAIRATLVRDLDADGHGDVLVMTSDEQGQATLETVMHGAAAATGRVPLAPYANAAGCRAVAANITALGSELALASVDFVCATANVMPTTLPAAPAAAAPVAPGGAALVPAPNDLQPVPGAAAPTAPAVPSAPAQTHQFVVDVSQHPHVLLHVAAESASALALTVSGADVDGDEHLDVQVAVQATLGDAEPTHLTLTWLNRTSGLARERQEPENTLAELAKEAWRTEDNKPLENLAVATKTLELHQLLCRESGRAKLWVDEARGVSCGASSAAGKAAAARAVALAKTQALLPALEARAALDDAAYQLDAKSRERVTRTIAAIPGDTTFRWQQGPLLRAPNTPNVRLAALGFIDEDHLLLRGPTAQSYDLLTRTATPTGVPGSVLAADAANHFVITDIVRGCDGYHLSVVPAAQVIGGIVAGVATSEPLLQSESGGLDPSLCATSATRKSDRGGYTLVAMVQGGALLARGSVLRLVPLDAQGQASSAPRTLGSTEAAPTPLAPGALDASTRFFAVATTEGVAVVDRAAAESSKLVRPPPSCNGGPVSDAALSPSGHKIAMLCAGHIYIAEPAADGGNQNRPIP